MYHIKTIEDYKQGIETHTPIVADTSTLQMLRGNLKGFLVDYPQKLLIDEDISPTLAVRTMVPNVLWV